MTQFKPLSSMVTPRFADVATFFRLPIEKDLSKLVTKAMIGGALASWLTATIAGLII